MPQPEGYGTVQSTQVKAQGRHNRSFGRRPRSARRFSTRFLPADYSMASSAHPGSVAGRLFRNTIRRVLGKGRFEASGRL